MPRSNLSFLSFVSVLLPPLTLAMFLSSLLRPLCQFLPLLLPLRLCLHEVGWCWRALQFLLDPSCEIKFCIDIPYHDNVALRQRTTPCAPRNVSSSESPWQCKCVFALILSLTNIPLEAPSSGVTLPLTFLWALIRDTYVTR